MTKAQKRKKRLLQRIQRIINSISFTVFTGELKFRRVIDQRKEKEIKLLKRLGKRARICPICLIPSGKIIPLKNYRTKEWPLIGCHVCHHVDKNG